MGDRYAMNFNGDAIALMDSLKGMAGDFEYHRAEAPGAPESLTLHLENNTPLRQVIASANNRVEIKSIVPAMASMNDIFIRAVERSNRLS